MPCSSSDSVGCPACGGRAFRFGTALCYPSCLWRSKWRRARSSCPSRAAPAAAPTDSQNSGCWEENLLFGFARRQQRHLAVVVVAVVVGVVGEVVRDAEVYCFVCCSTLAPNCC